MTTPVARWIPRNALRACALAAVLAGCASAPEAPRAPEARPMSPAEARTFIARALPQGVADRAGWATDIYAAFSAMEIPPTAENVCAVVAITDQESNFRADP